ncbi:MAG: alginate lyase family protein [Planctomycetota bacterium]
MPVSTRIIPCVFALALLAPVTSAEVGEFKIAPVLPLTAEQQHQLQQLIQTNPRAAELAQLEIDAARATLDRPLTPLRVIHYEGLVNTHPKRIKAVESLRQMSDTARLLRAWQATSDSAFAAKLQQIIIAWADTYEPTGNDVNENKLYPLLVAYLALREQFTAPQQERVEAWVLALGKHHAREAQRSNRLNNRFTKSLRLVVITGRILDKPDWTETARQGAQRFIAASLFPDGTSHDLRERDTLTYHSSALRPLIQLSILLDGKHPDALYHWTSPNGGSVQKSVQYIIPYATGEKQHREWVHSRVDLDRRRAAAGLEKYRIGRLYEPQQATSLLADAVFYEPQLTPLLAQLLDAPHAQLPSWESLVLTSIAQTPVATAQPNP